jgi:hypothetical protein
MLVSGFFCSILLGFWVSRVLDVGFLRVCIFAAVWRWSVVNMPLVREEDFLRARRRILAELCSITEVKKP